MGHGGFCSSFHMPGWTWKSSSTFGLLSPMKACGTVELPNITPFSPNSSGCDWFSNGLLRAYTGWVLMKQVLMQKLDIQAPLELLCCARYCLGMLQTFGVQWLQTWLCHLVSWLTDWQLKHNHAQCGLCIKEVAYLQLVLPYKDSWLSLINNLVIYYIPHSNKYPLIFRMPKPEQQWLAGSCAVS